MRNVEMEEAFVQTFILPDKRDRYVQMLASPRKRSKILGTLYHTLDYAPALATLIPSREHFSEPVIRLLRQKGASATCYLISPDADLDQQEMTLQDAVSQIIGQDMTAIVCCLPGRLTYYKAELRVYVLEKPLSLDERTGSDASARQ